MDSKLILAAARGTLDGTLSFPEVVGQLLAAGVEYYHVDYVGLRKRFYSADGEMMATSINYEGLPAVAPEFDAAALRANILDSQRHGQPYREFTRRGPCRTGHRVASISGRLQRPHRRPAHGMVPRRGAGPATIGQMIRSPARINGQSWHRRPSRVLR